MYGSDGSNKGTLTDFDGNYSVELAPGIHIKDFIRRV